MTFDEKGLLTPATMVALTTVEFEELFVNAFPDSATRQLIFASYQQFTEQTKPNRFGKRFKKGFVQIVYNSQ